MTNLITCHPSLQTLLVDADPRTFAGLKEALRATPHRLSCCANPEEALLEVRQTAYDLIFVDAQPAGDQLAFIGQLAATSRWSYIVATHTQPSAQLVVRAMKQGARDFLTKPYGTNEVRTVVEATISLNHLTRAARRSPQALPEDSTVDLSTTSAALRSAIETARSAAEGSAPVLLWGEAGTGKRTLARAIHAWGPRAQRPLGVGHCRAPSRAYLEAEWFGALRGSVGVKSEREGRIAFCDGGTLLVEEIDQLPLPTQCKLLRLIQHGEYERVGDFATRAADVRILATASVDLESRVADGRFHPELHSALSAIKLELPPLRHRPRDTLHIAEKYLVHYARQTRRNIVGFTHGAADSLKRHSWPGNLRELRSLVESAVLIARNERVDTCDFPANALNRVNAATLGDPVPLDRIEELHIRGVLSAAPSMEAAAATLGIDVVTLWRRRKRYGL